MNRAPGSEKKSETARRPQEASSATPDPKLLEFVKSLARAAAREDHRRAAGAEAAWLEFVEWMKRPDRKDFDKTG
jgi:hypothetical protein